MTGMRQLGDPDEDGGVDALQRVVAAAFAQLGDVRAGGEDPLPGPGSPAMMRIFGVPLQVGADGVQLVDHLLVDRVADLGAVEQHHHAVLALLDQRACRSPPASRRRCLGAAIRRAPAAWRCPGRRRCTWWRGRSCGVPSRSIRPSRVIDEPGPGGAERVAQGDRAAVAVHDLRVQPSSRMHGQRLGGERLVELDGAEVADAEAGALEHLLGGRDRADAHDFGRAAGRGAVDDAGARA